MDTKNEKKHAAGSDEVPAIIELLKTLNKGKLLVELNEAAKGIAVKALELGRSGELSFKLTFKPVPNSQGMQLFVDADINAKPPRSKPKSNLFFVDEDGVLLRNDPNQRDWVAEQESAEAAGAKKV